MSHTFESVVASFPDCEVVGGDILVRVDGVMRVYGRTLGDIFVLTDEGRAALAEVGAEDKPKNKGGRPRKADADGAPSSTDPV